MKAGAVPRGFARRPGERERLERFDEAAVLGFDLLGPASPVRMSSGKGGEPDGDRCSYNAGLPMG